ncbi:MAG: ExbD/TolR family protein [Chitinophagales bacterium]
MAKGKRKLQEINASSMADIAFLLLIFFLVTTTMDIDKGLITLLPPISEEEPPPPDKANQRNVLDILVNKNDQLLVKGDLMDVIELKELAKTHVNNNGVDPRYSLSPQKAIVSLKNDRGTSYEIYITVQNELKAAYNELRDEYAINNFGVKYADLKRENQKTVRNVYPLRISEAEPENY